MTQIDRINGLIGSIAVKAPCRVATTANITLSGEQTIDGVAVIADDRALVKDQTDKIENGIYNVSATNWKRTPDWNGARDITLGTLVVVLLGTVSSDLIYKVTTINPSVGLEDVEFDILNVNVNLGNLERITFDLYASIMGDGGDMYIDTDADEASQYFRTVDSGTTQHITMKLGGSLADVLLFFAGVEKLRTTTDGVDISGELTLDTPLAIAEGGTGQITAQAAIDILTAVAGATTGQVLTKDDSGNATFEDAAGGGVDASFPVANITQLPDASVGGTDNFHLYGAAELTSESSGVLDGFLYMVGESDGSRAIMRYSENGGGYWISRTTVSKDSDLYGVVYHSGLVAVGEADATDAMIQTSNSAASSWLERSNPKPFTLRAIATNQSIMCAVGDPDGTDAYMVTATSGSGTWTERENPLNVQLNGIATDGTNWVAVGASDGTRSYVITATDPTGTWTQQTAGTGLLDYTLNAVATDGNGTWVAVGNKASVWSYMAYSTDNGVTWDYIRERPWDDIHDIHYANGLFVTSSIVDNWAKVCFVSADGINWNMSAFPDVALNEQSRCVMHQGYYGSWVWGGEPDGTYPNLWKSLSYRPLT